MSPAAAPEMDPVLIAFGAHAAETVGEADRAELIDLFVACEEYVRSSEGRAPGSAQVEDLLCELPPGRTHADKHVLGIRASDRRLVGVLDVVRDYPGPGEWYLGLLLLLPGERGSGLGERAYRAVEAWARRRGAVAMRLAVLEQNPRARRFWERLGFSVESSRTVRHGERESVAIRMVRRLGLDAE